MYDQDQPKVPRYSETLESINAFRRRVNDEKLTQYSEKWEVTDPDDSRKLHGGIDNPPTPFTLEEYADMDEHRTTYIYNPNILDGPEQKVMKTLTDLQVGPEGIERAMSFVQRRDEIMKLIEADYRAFRDLNRTTSEEEFNLRSQKGEPLIIYRLGLGILQYSYGFRRPYVYMLTLREDPLQKYVNHFTRHLPQHATSMYILLKEFEDPEATQ